MNLCKLWPTSKAAKATAEFYNINVDRENAVHSCFQTLASKHFPVLMCSKAAGVVPTVEESIKALVDDLKIHGSEASRIFVANLSYAGTDAAKLNMPVAQLVGDLVSSNPINTCALIIVATVRGSDHCSCAFALLNSSTEVGERGDSGTVESVAAIQAATLKMFRDTEFKLHVVDVHWQFTEQSVPYQSRPLHHFALLCISNAMDERQTLLSKFSSSYLFVRQGLPNAVPALPSKEHARPLVGQKPELRLLTGMSNKNKARDPRQWITGSRLYSQALLFGDVVLVCSFGQVIFYLLKGLEPNFQRHVVLVDLMPYDGWLQVAAIEGSRGFPRVLGAGGAQCRLQREVSNETLCCISLAWTSSQLEKESIVDLVAQIVKERLLLWLRLGGSNLRGATDVPPLKPQVQLKQPLALDEKLFKYTKPLSDGTLPFRQTVLSTFAQMPGDVQCQLQEFVQKHNCEFNPSGRPYKDNKRGLNDTSEIQEEATAASLQCQAGLPQNMELLLQTLPHADVLPGLVAELEVVVVRNGGTERSFRKLNWNLLMQRSTTPTLPPSFAPRCVLPAQLE